MTMPKSVSFIDLAKDWGALAATVIAMITFVMGYQQTESAKESQIVIMVENQKQMGKDISELKTIVSSYNVVVNDIKRLDTKESETSERLGRLEAVQIDRATVVANLSTISALQTKILDNLQLDIRHLQEKANSH